MRALVAFGLNDLRNVRRDPLLGYLVLVPWLMVALARLLVPAATDWLAASYGFDLVPYYPLLLSLYFVLQIPILFGVIVGLMVLDERDDGTLVALQVTPVSLTGYALFRLVAVTLLGTIFAVVGLALTGLLPLAVLPAVVPGALVGGLFGIVTGLLLPAFANNKLEGLALMKGFGILMIAPLAAYFVEDRWQVLFGVFPSYWPARAFWAASAGDPVWPYALVGLVFNLLLLILLLRRLRVRLYQG